MADQRTLEILIDIGFTHTFPGDHGWNDARNFLTIFNKAGETVGNYRLDRLIGVRIREDAP